MLSDMKSGADRQLEAVSRRVSAALDSAQNPDGVTLEMKIATVREMLGDYVEGVAAWRRKATLVVQDIEVRQRGLRDMLRETQGAARRRKAAFEEGQAKRARDAEELCKKIMSSPM